MEQDDIVKEEPVRAETVGARLQRVREEKGFDLARVAAETRIPQRHLVAIEAGAFGKLPSRTYAVGFSRTYARMLGLDEHEVVDAVRGELAAGNPNAPAAAAKFEPGDPARVPGRGLAWLGVIAAVIFIAGLYTFYSSYFAPGLGPAPLSDPQAAEAPAQPGATRPSAPQAAPTGGPVVFTAILDDTWVKFYDASGERLYEAQMAKGDSFTIPADAEGPQIWTGRPYALAITVGGRPVPKLSEEDTIVKDVPVSAAALLARADTPTAPDANAAPTTPGANRPGAAPAGT